MKNSLSPNLPFTKSITPVIRGTDGNDRLAGSGVFDGGKGNDTIIAQGNGSQDTLRFNLGDGQDLIGSYDWQGKQDTVQFGNDVTADMIGFARSGDNLIVTVGDKGDRMTFDRFFADANRQTFTRFEFADGSVWSNIKDTALWKGTDFTPVIRGTDGNDRLAGSGVFDGGKGNDTIIAQDNGSQDTLRFNLGDGQDLIGSYDWQGKQDTVQFGNDVTADMIGFARSGDNLIVTVGDKGDRMTFDRFFADANRQTFTRFEFADGSVWSNIKDTALWKGTDFTPVIRGTDGNDRLAGSGAFDGGKGNDTIIAQDNGSQDTLRFNLGDGQDLIGSYDWQGKQDTVQFGNDVTADMIGFARSGDNLIVTVGDKGDRMTFDHFFADARRQTFTRFEFADGSVWSNIKDTALWKGTDFTPVIRGTDGNDRLAGSGVFDGGKGNDTIIAQDNGSQDTLRFNLGDGQDLIGSYDWQYKQDTVQFGNDVTADMIGFARSGDNLIVTVGDKGDRMTFDHFFADARRQTFTRFEFADGSVWSNIKDTALWKGTDFTPVIRGTDGNDRLAGSGVFDGGKGNDTIIAQDNGSQDTLRFNLGDGQDLIGSYDWQGKQDTVQFGNDVTADMIGFARSGDNLIVTVGDKGDRMTFDHFFADANRQTFTRFEFADGSVWSNIKDTALWKGTDFTPVIRGTDGNDRLAGSGVFDGGKGNDTIIAQDNGSQDTLRFNLGDGQDLIGSYDWQGKQDTVQFGNDVTADMIGFARSGDNLIVTVGDKGDRMTFDHFFADARRQTFTRFEFADGSVWSNIKDTALWKGTDFTPVIRGTDGNDRLAGSGVFDGGKGNDTIIAQGNGSQDTLRFNLGDGQDLIGSYDWQGKQDTVQFGNDVTADMIGFARSGDNLIVTVGDKGDRMTFDHFFADARRQTFTRFEFADGSVWSNIKDTALWKGTDFTPVIRGTDGNDRLAGSGVFDGGKGNDTIIAQGNGSQDTLRFNLGDGQDLIGSYDWQGKQDTVQFGNDVTADMIGFARSGDNLIVTVGDKGDRMTFDHFFADARRQTFTRFEFADGSVWSNIKDTALWKGTDFTPVIRGTDGNDRLAGSGVFDGGKGNDTIIAQGNGSQDTLRFNLGDGQDLIGSYDWQYKQDTVQFGNDVTADMIGFARSGDNLIVTVGDKGDRMTFDHFFADARRQTFTRFEFADGSVWSNIKDTALWKGTDFTPVIRGTDGNDRLAGSGVFDGGKGNDTIIAQDNGSQDTLRFNLGDGQDLIGSYDWQGKQDTVQFGNDVTADMIGFARSGDNLIVTVGDKDDRMTFDHFFADARCQTFTRFEFADGSVWSNIKDTVLWKGTDFTPVIRGTDGNDRLAGSGVFDGGKGNDTIIAQDNGSQDTLRFNLGDGQDLIGSYDWQGKQDTVQFGKDVTADMIGFARSGDNLIVTVGDKDDRMTFDHFFADARCQTFTRFEFADGSVWSNIRDAEAWKNGIYKSSPTSGNEMAAQPPCFSADILANQANNLINLMATFVPQSSGISLQPEQNAAPTAMMLANSAA